jgi:hypothetical protein
LIIPGTKIPKRKAEGLLERRSLRVFERLEGGGGIGTWGGREGIVIWILGVKVWVTGTDCAAPELEPAQLGLNYLLQQNQIRKR